MSKKTKQTTFKVVNKNIFEDMGFTAEEAKELQFRSFLMSILVKYIQLERLKQKAAAEKLGVTQSRISNLIHGKIDLFSTSMLLAMLEKAGFEIYERIQANVDNLFAYNGSSSNHNTASAINI